MGRRCLVGHLSEVSAVVDLFPLARGQLYHCRVELVVVVSRGCATSTQRRGVTDPSRKRMATAPKRTKKKKKEKLINSYNTSDSAEQHDASEDSSGLIKVL